MATVAARRAGHYFIHALYTLYFTKTHAPRAVRPYHHHHQTRHTRRLLILTGMRLCEAFPRELRYGQRLCRSQCAPAADRPHTVPYGAPPELSHSVLYACAARPRPHRLEIRSPPPCAPALSEAPMALRAGRREAKVEAPRARRAILKPNPFARPPPRGRARPTQAAAPRLAGGPPAATLAAQARPHRTIPQAAGTGSASPPPPLAAARRGPMQHRRSRSIDLSRGAVGSGAHGVQIWACFARRPRMVQLVSALLRRPHAPDRWSTVAPNDGRSRQPAVGVDGRSAHPAGSPQECPCCR